MTKTLKMDRSNAMSGSVKLLLVVFWIVAIILPLVTMFSGIAAVDLDKIFGNDRFIEALLHSVSVSGISTIISVALAGSLAWCTSRTAIRFKNAFAVLFTLPMLIPSISHGMGLIILLGSNGLLTKLFSLQTTIYGFGGIVVGSVIYSFPVAYLMLLDMLRFEDSTPYEAAQVMGLSKWDRFFAITLPYLRKPLISVFFATFTMIITDYGVPLMIGGKYITLPVLMYQEVIGMLDFGKGSVIGVILLIPALIACLLDLVSRDKGNQSYVNKPFSVKPKKLRDGLSYAFCGMVSLLILCPIATFSCIAFVKKYPIDLSFSLANIEQALRMNADRYLLNSVVIALCVSVIGVLLAIVSAYFTARMPSKCSKLLHLLSITSLAIPGIVLGLSYVLFFKKTFLYGTIAILILVNTMHFFSSPYLMMYNTFGKLNAHLESVGKTLGVGRWHILKDVLLPLSRSTILEMASYFFVNSMMTISAVSFLASAQNKPVALMITQFEGQMQLECAAFVSFMILAVNLAVKGIVFFIKRSIAKRG